MPSVSVAVVGPCASGKTTVVESLRERGYDAFAVAQEHSRVAGLWRRQEPDFLVFLDVDLDTIRQRRDNPAWPRWLYETQLERLKAARDNADVIVDTTRLSPEEVVERALSVIDGRAGRDE